MIELPTPRCRLAPTPAWHHLYARLVNLGRRSVSGAVARRRNHASKVPVTAVIARGSTCARPNETHRSPAPRAARAALATVLRHVAQRVRGFGSNRACRGPATGVSKSTFHHVSVRPHECKQHRTTTGSLRRAATLLAYSPEPRRAPQKSSAARRRTFRSIDKGAALKGVISLCPEGAKRRTNDPLLPPASWPRNAHEQFLLPHPSPDIRKCGARNTKTLALAAHRRLAHPASAGAEDTRFARRAVRVAESIKASIAQSRVRLWA
jgi:hypothetical protein